MHFLIWVNLHAIINLNVNDLIGLHQRQFLNIINEKHRKTIITLTDNKKKTIKGAT